MCTFNSKGGKWFPTMDKYILEFLCAKEECQIKCEIIIHAKTGNYMVQFFEIGHKIKFDDLNYRNVGPTRGGRSTTVCGVVEDPAESVVTASVKLGYEVLVSGGSSIDLDLVSDNGIEADLETLNSENVSETLKLPVYTL